MRSGGAADDASANGRDGDHASPVASGMIFPGRFDATVRSRARNLRGGEACDGDQPLRCLAGPRQTQIRRSSTHGAVAHRFSAENQRGGPAPDGQRNGIRDVRPAYSWDVACRPMAIGSLNVVAAVTGARWPTISCGEDEAIEQRLAILHRDDADLRLRCRALRRI
jgi:hypothetical protein